jgi:hypothetical protein
MANIINRQQTFSTNGTVTAAGLHNLIDTALVNSAIIKNQQEITTIGTADLLLIAPDSVDASLAPRKVTVQNLFDDGLAAGTFTSLNLTGDLTYGTATGNRTVSTSATITTGTIPNLTSSTANITLGTIPTLTAGTTTSTAANITSGTVQTLTASTASISQGSAILTQGTIATLNSTTGTIASLISTTGTIASLISTTGTIASLNSTTGTITNLSTTLAGDFTISQGTGTVGTSKITFPMLSTSATESDNVASRTAKVWVNFDGTTNTGGNCTIRGDFNVSTVADNGTGNYTINFSPSFSSTNFCAVGCAATTIGDRQLSTLRTSASSCTVIAGQTASVNTYDSSEVSVVIFS